MFGINENISWHAGRWETLSKRKIKRKRQGSDRDDEINRKESENGYYESFHFAQGLDWVMKASPQDGTHILVKRGGDARALYLYLCPPSEHSKLVAICKPGRGPLARTRSACALTLALPGSRTRCPVWYVLIAAGDYY